MHHYHKRIVYMDKREKKESRDLRRIWLVRGEIFPEWSRARVVSIDNEGFSDVHDDELIEAQFTPHEIGLLDQSREEEEEGEE